MDVVCTLLVLSSFLLTFAHGDSFDGSTEANEKTPLELFPPKPTYAGQTRMPRTLFKKLHSGAAFLTGLKLGAILSKKKGFELGHGKIASTHSFQIFGKSVNSAMSLSYGNAGGLLPLVDDEQQPPTTDGDDRNGLNKDEKRIFQVTVIETPSNETENGDGNQRKTASDGEVGTTERAIVLFQDFEPPQEPEVDGNFINEHNRRVKEFNENLLRRKNSRF